MTTLRAGDPILNRAHVIADTGYYQPRVPEPKGVDLRMVVISEDGWRNIGWAMNDVFASVTSKLYTYGWDYKRGQWVPVPLDLIDQIQEQDDEPSLIYHHWLVNQEKKVRDKKLARILK